MTTSLDFGRRRIFNFALIGMMYALFYMARYNFAAINPYLAEIFGWTNVKIGVVSSAATVVYGLSVFFNGPLADRIGGRRAILIGASGACAFNLLFGFMHLALAKPAFWEGQDAARHVVEEAQLRMGLTASTALALFATLWAFNHFFQSFGALSIVKVNAAWFHVRERGFFAGIFGILIRLGLILAFGSPVILEFLPWQWVFWVPAALLAVLFILNFLFLRNTPRDAGFDDFETGDESAEEKASAPSLGLVLRKVFASRVAWMIAASSMMIGFVRRSVIDDWWPKYMVNVLHADARHLHDFLAYRVTYWGIAIAGICGGIAFGVASDRLFGSRRGPVIVVGFCGMATVLLGFGLSGTAGGPLMSAAWLAMLSFFVNGAHGMVGGAASMDFGGKKAAATAAGLFDGMQYLAGSLVGVGMGRLLDKYGWSVWQFAPIPFAIVGAVVMSRLWNALPAGARRA
jgi:MFS transporter, OPA family, glycerol-3-phosphate transporter